MSDTEFVVLTGLSSVCSSMIAKLFVHPLDTIKSKMQIQSCKVTSSNMKGQLTKIIKYTLQKEGIQGLYKGFTIATLGLVPAMSLFFMSYEKSKQILMQQQYFQSHNLQTFFISGIIAESISCIFFVPIDILKERFQIMNNLQIYEYKNNRDAIRQIIRNEGVLGLYRAYGATVCSFGPFSALHMTFYEYFKLLTCHDPQSPSFYESMFLSAVSGSLASIITNPLDITKMRMQVQRGSISLDSQQGNFGYRNMFHGIQCIYQSEGLLALFKGTSARVLYHCPNVALIMSLMEIIRSKLIQLSNSH